MAAIPSRTPVNNLAHPSMTHTAAISVCPYLTTSPTYVAVPHLYLRALGSVVLMPRHLDFLLL